MLRLPLSPRNDSELNCPSSLLRCLKNLMEVIQLVSPHCYMVEVAESKDFKNLLPSPQRPSTVPVAAGNTTVRLIFDWRI